MIDFAPIPKRDRGTLDQALRLLALPREVGLHPEDGKPVRVLSGRFGPYIKHGDTNANVPKGKDPAAITLEEALALIAERAAKGGGKKAKKAAKPAKPSKAKAAKSEETDGDAEAKPAKKKAAKK